MRTLLFVLSALLVGLASSFAPPTAAPQLLRRAASSAPAAAAAVRLAYNPQPSKAPPPQVALVPEQTFWEGAPSITETLIPGLSLFTVVGVIPFSASIARQAWTKYKFTNRRIEIATGFQGKDVVQVLWREILDIKWRRRGGRPRLLADGRLEARGALGARLRPQPRLDHE